MDEPELIAKIESAIDRASRTIRNFLRFARAPDAQVRDIDLGGRIEVDNHPRVGCTFRLILPRTRL